MTSNNRKSLKFYGIKFLSKGGQEFNENRSGFWVRCLVALRVLEMKEVQDRRRLYDVAQVSNMKGKIVGRIGLQAIRSGYFRTGWLEIT